MNLTMIIPAVILGFIVIFSTQPAFAQTFDVNQTTPCFLNYTAGYKVWDDCGMDEDWLQASLIGFQWVTGGYFSFILLGIIVMISYIKYHKALYPFLIGALFIPVAYYVVPNAEVFWYFILLFIGMTFTVTIYKVFVRQTSPHGH